MSHSFPPYDTPSGYIPPRGHIVTDEEKHVLDLLTSQAEFHHVGLMEYVLVVLRDRITAEYAAELGEKGKKK